MIGYLRRYNLQSPVALIRLMIQQSNCFIVVERGVGMQNMAQERQLAASGQARQDSNVGGGQMVAADFVLTPGVVFSENNAGGVGGGVANYFGHTAGAIAGGLKFKEAQTSMLLADTRSGVQVAAAEGSTEEGGHPAGRHAVGRWHRRIGRRLREHQRRQDHRRRLHGQLQHARQGRSATTPPCSARWGRSRKRRPRAGPTKAGAVFSEGDVLTPKIGNVQMRADASDTSKLVATLARGDEVVVTGSEKDGFIQVTNAAGAAGWVKIVLVNKR